MTTLHLACAADATYAPHSAAMLHSVIAHSRPLTVRVAYLHGPEFPQRSIELLTDMVERNGGTISFFSIPAERIVGLARRGHQTSPTWYRIYLPELLPDVDRVLYLDCDAIVVDSLEPLWQTDIRDDFLGAVTNVFEPQFLDLPAKLGLPGPEAYFNAGVLLMNLDLMRREGSTVALEDYAFTHREELFWVDQDTLNVVLGGRRKALHPRWNCMNSVMEFSWAPDVFGATAVAEARRSPGIRHFEGPPICKPWHYLCEQSMGEAYFEHRRLTPWPRVRREGLTPANVARRLARVAHAPLSRQAPG